MNDTSPPSHALSYQTRRLWQSQMLPVRNMQYPLRSWEPEQPNRDLPLLVLAHGWMDVAASWQFVVDAISDASTQGSRIASVSGCPDAICARAATL